MSSSSDSKFTALDVSNNGLVIYGSQNNELEIWSYRDNERKFILPFHQDLITDVKFIN